MRKEFNLHAFTPLDQLTAAAMMAPALFLSFQQFGWTGFAVTAAALAFTKPVLSWLTRNSDQHPMMAEEFPHEDTPDEIRLQHICDELSPAFGLDGIRATMIRPTKQAAFSLPDKVYISSETVKILDDDELRFIVAHELDHIRAHDHEGHSRNKILNTVAGGAAVLSLADIVMGGVMHITTLTAPYLTAFAYMGTMASINLTHRHMLRAMEYRADENAMRVTHNPHKAISALAKCTYIMSGKNAKALEPQPRQLKDLMYTHPSLRDRAKRIMKTWEDLNRNRRAIRSAQPVMA